MNLRAKNKLSLLTFAQDPSDEESSQFYMDRFRDNNFLNYPVVFMVMKQLKKEVNMILMIFLQLSIKWNWVLHESVDGGGVDDGGVAVVEVEVGLPNAVNNKILSNFTFLIG